MVEFGKRLREECAQHGADWQQHCIDYGALKNLIAENKKKKGRAVSFDDKDEYISAVVAASSYDHEYDDDLVVESPSSQFRYALDREIEKAVLFVLQEQGSIAKELDQLAVRRAKFVDTTYGLLRREGVSNVRLVSAALDELHEIHDGYAIAARSILRFVAFVDLNVTAVRKILKKHDKITKRKLSYTYLTVYMEEKVDSHLDQLYNDGGLSSLVVTLRRAFGELHHVELELRDVKQREEKQQKHRRIKSMPLSAIMGGRGGPPSHERQNSTMASSSSFVGNNIIGAKVALVTTPKEPLLQLIQMSRDKLKQNTKYVDFVAAQALMFEDSDEEEGQQTDSTDHSRAQRLSSLINLMSTFLYMTNYYIVAPTCGQYAARVGSSESMAGIVIGMTPNAALVATVLYAFWSNHSYKPALIFAASCSLLGNVAYALALSYDSIELVMIGRFLNGFGSARSINREFCSLLGLVLSNVDIGDLL